MNLGSVLGGAVSGFLTGGPTGALVGGGMALLNGVGTQGGTAGGGGAAAGAGGAGVVGVAERVTGAIDAGGGFQNYPEDYAVIQKLSDEGQPLNDMSLPVWDFVIKREGGTGLRLHPQRSTVKVETFEIEGPEEPVEAPPQGNGCSWGRGGVQVLQECTDEGDAAARPLQG